ncbi:MAG TPA: hypothetical protein VG317_14615 [Pseudonocardiaceae bacterium]|jgi:hypothetical protein|nr:hypothetical protein [Pseudonocardiaceae bacterium]
MSNRETTDLDRAIGQLRQCVGSLRSRYGESAGVRRLINDLERLDIDAADLAGRAGRSTPPKPRQGDSGKPEVVVVPDTPYDPALWHGADDEGVGGVHPHR